MENATWNSGWCGSMIERATRGNLHSSSDAEIRRRCRTAPAHVRRAMNVRREERGMPPLWPNESGAAIAPKARVATLARLKKFLARHGRR